MQAVLRASLLVTFRLAQRRRAKARRSLKALEVRARCSLELDGVRKMALP